MLLPPNPLPTVADEVVAALPALLKRHPAGPLAAQVAAHIHIDYQSARRAMETLDADKRARIVRRGRGLHLVGPDYRGRLCVICRKEFKATRKETLTCSHSCGRHLAYRNEDMRRRHRQSVKASRTPELRERQSRIHSERCADPAVRQQMSDNNRRSWRDPVKRANRIVAIKDAWRGEKATQRRAKARQKKLSLWADPEWKQQTVEAMRTGSRGRFKRGVLGLLHRNSKITAQEIAGDLGLSQEQVKIIWRRSFRLGEIERKPPDGRRRQSADHVNKRVESTKRTKSSEARI